MVPLCRSLLMLVVVRPKRERSHDSCPPWADFRSLHLWYHCLFMVHYEIALIVTHFHDAVPVKCL